MLWDKMQVEKQRSSSPDTLKSSRLNYWRVFIDELDSVDHVVKFQQLCGLRKVTSSVPLKRDKRGSEKEKRRQCASGSGGEYSIGQPWVHLFFQLSRYGGEEFLFLILFPYIMWCLDTWILRRVSFSFAFCMFVCTAGKDLIGKERPRSPPVLRLEQRSADEFGLPSTHAVSITSTLLPLLNHSIHRYLNGWPSWVSTVLCVMVVFAVCSVSLSRIHNGMHSFLDVTCGLVAALLMINSPVTKLDLMVDDYLLATKCYFVPSALIASGFLFCLLYPKVDKWNTGRGDSIILVGMHFGYLVGCWFNFCCLGIQSDLTPGPSLSFFSYSQLLPPIVKLVAGLPLVFAARLLIRSVVLSITCVLLGVNRNEPLVERKPAVEMVYKYFSYLLLGFFGVTVTPLYFELIGIT